MKDMDQFFTDPELAERIVKWALRSVDQLPLAKIRVLEPSAGDGAIVGALLENGIKTYNLTPVEIDEAQAEDLHTVHRGIPVECCDFMQFVPLRGYHLAVMNPPYRDGRAEAHCARALRMCRRVVILCLASFCFSEGRQGILWQHARVKRRVILAKRPKFHGPDCTGESAKYDYQILELERCQRLPGQVDQVLEEIW